VTTLEPRTPHQPEKLKKLSKNDYVFTPSISYVNENYAFLTTRIFNRVHAVHRPVPEFGAALQYNFARKRCWVRVSANGMVITRGSGLALFWSSCENPGYAATGKGDWSFSRVQTPFAIEAREGCFALQEKVH
jgi:hypothetical protein